MLRFQKPSADAHNMPSGFTLMEVLIALVILAISLTAIMKATSSDIKKTQQLTNLTAAHYVAMNALSLVQLGLIDETAPEQVTSLMGQRWRWHVSFSKSKLASLTTVRISVNYPNRKKTRYELQGYRISAQKTSR